jgi:hypothetical protein
MVLTPRTVGALVEALHRKDKEATVFAIESKAAWSGHDAIEVAGRRARVREARSALRLREVLHEERGGDHLVILTDLDARAFGCENLAKVALRRIEPVQPWPVVRLVFGVASIDPASGPFQPVTSSNGRALLDPQARVRGLMFDGKGRLWVGTRGSNWNRLIDELRCVWVPKCMNAYVEVGDPHDYEHFGW